MKRPTSTPIRGLRDAATACVLAVTCVLATAAAASAQPVVGSAREQIAALLDAKHQRTPIEEKLDTPLWLEVLRRRGDPLFDALPALRPTLPLEADGRVRVEVRSRRGARAADRTDAIADRLRQLDGVVTRDGRADGRLRARLPAAQLLGLAASPDVERIQLPDPATTHAITSQGDVAHRADLARVDVAADGSGMLVCALSDGIGELATVQAGGELPAVTVLPGQAGAPGDTEGTAMLEIIHDLAPGAELAFATAFGGQATFATNIDALAASGCDVIVDDVIYLTEPVFQDGLVAQAVENAVAGGAVYVASAANFGNLDRGSSGVWEGDFVAGSAGHGGFVHVFGPGVESDLITADPAIGISLQWADAWGGSGNDYDLFLLDSTGTQVEAASTVTQNGNDDPLEYISSSGTNHWGKRLVVVLDSGAPRYLHLNTHGGRLEAATDGQIYGHPAADGAISTAAVRASLAGGGAFIDDPSVLHVETFSSDGPRRVFFEADGTPITPGDFGSSGGALRDKPDMTAANNVSTTTPGFTKFTGTSAAAPHVAGIAALMLETRPVFGPAEIHDALSATAVDIGPAGFDRSSGAGVVDALDALREVAPEIAPALGPAAVATLSLVIGLSGWASTRSRQPRAASPRRGVQSTDSGRSEARTHGRWSRAPTPPKRKRES